MSQSYTLLRNQINEAYDHIRPITSSAIIDAISALEVADEERNVLNLSSVIVRLRGGDESDFVVITSLVGLPAMENSVSRPIFENFINAANAVRAEEAARAEEFLAPPPVRFASVDRFLDMFRNR